MATATSHSTVTSESAVDWATQAGTGSGPGATEPSGFIVCGAWCQARRQLAVRYRDDARRRLGLRSHRSRRCCSPSSKAWLLPGRGSGGGLGLLVVEAGLEHAPSAVKVSVCRYDGGVKGCQVRRAWRAGGACSPQRCDRPCVAAQVEGGALVRAVRP